MLATLRLFGFPAMFIRWIEECVTSAHFSVFLNGEDGDFLYHWRCQELKLFQLCFADDLLLLCKADVRSMTLFSRQKIDSHIKGWEGVHLSFAGRVQLIKSVLVSLEVYWATAFILPKGIIKEVIKRLRTFLWKGTSESGYPKVAWDVVCRLVEEGGQVQENKVAWGWRKMLALRHTLLPYIQYQIGDGTSFFLWHDPRHTLGPLILRFPCGPQLTNTGLFDKLNVVMENA
ncbi:hypothetical protein Sango_2436200 [Sesamum angolense]|uniref:Uncharacterized protein n=1 Tax=Sesamum angolense TaxID=2727404 RepID=A0AAE2BK42_9LAMI|nr:hypothetical protein Sango_2436200 [Sesamum angolense]